MACSRVVHRACIPLTACCPPSAAAAARAARVACLSKRRWPSLDGATVCRDDEDAVDPRATLEGDGAYAPAEPRSSHAPQVSTSAPRAAAGGATEYTGGRMARKQRSSHAQRSPASWADPQRSGRGAEPPGELAQAARGRARTGSGARAPTGADTENGMVLWFDPRRGFGIVRATRSAVHLTLPQRSRGKRGCSQITTCGARTHGIARVVCARTVGLLGWSLAYGLALERCSAPVRNPLKLSPSVGYATQ
jgi:hypothetical protein